LPILRPVEPAIEPEPVEEYTPEEPYYESEPEPDEQGPAPASRPVHEQDDNFSDVTGLSEEDEDELFGLGEGDEDPTSSDDDLDDVLGLSAKDNEELFGLGDNRPNRRPKRYKKTARRYIPPAGGVGGMQY
jgi:hypothetical protein